MNTILFIIMFALFIIKLNSKNIQVHIAFIIDKYDHSKHFEHLTRSAAATI